MRSRLVTLLAACLCACIGVGVCMPCSAGELTITGTVVTPDGQPAAGATAFSTWYFVSEAGGFEPVEAEATTDESGAFTIRMQGNGEPVRESEVVVGALKEGYGVGWTAAPPAATAGLSIALRRPTTATGIVVNEAGEPVVGAEVAISHIFIDSQRGPLGTSRLKTETDQAGRFQLTGLPAGAEAGLVAYAAGCQRAYLEAKPTEQLTDQTIVLHPAAVISGRVTRDGEPVEGVMVLARSVTPAGPGAVATSGKDGAYAIADIAPGTYSVSIHWLVSVGAVGDRTTMPHRDVKCDLDAPATGIDFELIEGGLVTGTLRDERSGEGVTRGSVAAYASRDDFPFGAFWQAMSGRDGAYRLRLPAGTYWLHGQANGYEYRGTEPWLHEVKVEQAQTVAGFDIALTPTPRIAGTVIDLDGTPVAGAAIRTPEQFAPTPVTGADGRFDIPVGYGGLPTEVCAVDTERGLVGRVTIAQETTEAEIVLAPAVVATGQVVDPDGNGIARIGVAAKYVPPIDAGSTILDIALATVQTDAEGHFRLPCLPHGVEVTIYVDGEDGRFISERKWAKSVTLPPGEDIDLGPTVLDRAGQRLAGRVMDAERQLIAGCTVVEIGTRRVVTTDDLGRFELTGLPILDFPNVPDQFYECSIIAADADRKLFAGTARVDPAWGYDLDLVLEPPGAVRGRALDATGAPMTGLQMHLDAAGIYRDQWPSEAADIRDRVVLLEQTTAADDGAWEFEGLIPGLRYQVWGIIAGNADARIYRDFMPIPGDTVDLGDVSPNEDW